MFIITQINKKFTNLYNKCTFIINDITKNGKVIQNTGNYINMFYIYMCYLIRQKFFNNNIEKYDRKNYKLEYYLNDKKYIYIVKPIRGPSPFKYIQNDKLEDITNEILSYLGPRYDFMNIKYTPEFFGYNEIKFMLQNGDIITFKNNENIILDKLIQ